MMSDTTSEFLSSDHDMIVRLWERAESNTKRIAELVDWKHDHLPAIIVDLQKSILTLNKDTGALRGEVTTLCGTVDKLAGLVSAVLPVITRQEDHERDCVEAGKENVRHREGFEERVNVRFDKGEAARAEMARKVDAIRSWVISGVIATLLAALGAMVTIIWAAIQHGGLSLFSHP